MARMNLSVQFTLNGREYATKLLEAAQLAREMADHQPWNFEANEIATLIEEGVKGLTTKVER